jgi:hypothetical protein
LIITDEQLDRGFTILENALQALSDRMAAASHK